MDVSAVQFVFIKQAGPYAAASISDGTAKVSVQTKTTGKETLRPLYGSVREMLIRWLFFAAVFGLILFPMRLG